MPAWSMQIQSFLILVLMFWGVSQHRHRMRHVRTMSLVMLWDVILILQIELSRQAILKASHALQNPWMLNVHVSIAVSTVLCYVAMIITGRRLLRGDNEIRTTHRWFGRTTLCLRLLTFITSFWAVVPKDA